MAQLSDNTDYPTYFRRSLGMSDNPCCTVLLTNGNCSFSSATDDSTAAHRAAGADDAATSDGTTGANDAASAYDATACNDTTW